MRDPALDLARLGQALRAHGVATNLRDELSGGEALAVVDLEDRDEVRTALRIALRIPHSAFGTFDRLFDSVWEGGPTPAATAAPPKPPTSTTPRASQALRWDPEARRMGDAPGTAADGEQPGYSSEAMLRRKAFDQSWSGGDLVAMERLLARLAIRLATRRSRRLVPTRGRGRADLRSSYRRALRTSGEILSLARRTRAVDEPRLVFLLDTSGSMDAHSRFLLSFVLSLRRAVPSAQVFAFNTELVSLTHSLAPGKVRLTLDRLAAEVPDWSGGTRIGDCLASFVAEHMARSVDGRTVIVLLSDGLDRGDPERLGGALRAIQRRARKVIWLNPLLGDARYEPTALGMRAALPYVDHFAAAHDLESLERLIPHLAS